MGEHRHLDAEHRGLHGGAEQRLVPLVVGMGDQGTTGRQQLGASGFDHHVLAVGLVERERVVEAGVVAGFQLGLRDGGLERDVPHRRGLGHVRLTTGVVVQEGALRDGLGFVGDRGVEQVPVHRQPDVPPEVLEHLLVDRGQLVAQLDEIAAADRDLALRVRLGRRGEVGVVRDRRVAADAVVVLHPALGRQAVVVPADRVEDLLAAHPLVAGDQVGVRVGEHVAHVQRTGHGGGRGVDGEHRLPRGLAVEGVRTILGPAGAPLVLQALQGGPVRYVHRADRLARGMQDRGGRGCRDGFTHGVHLTETARSHAHGARERDRGCEGSAADHLAAAAAATAAGKSCGVAMDLMSRSLPLTRTVGVPVTLSRAAAVLVRPAKLAYLPVV